jgi:uncharacterized protein DUF397
MLSDQWAKSTLSHTNGCLEARWMAAACANGNCVEARWHTATASATSNCVQVAPDPICGLVRVRDSKDPGGLIVEFTPAAWRLLLTEVACGRFDWAQLDPLEFDAAERAAFEAGVLGGEFDLPPEAVSA